MSCQPHQTGIVNLRRPNVCVQKVFRLFNGTFWPSSARFDQNIPIDRNEFRHIVLAILLYILYRRVWYWAKSYEGGSSRRKFSTI